MKTIEEVLEWINTALINDLSNDLVLYDTAVEALAELRRFITEEAQS